MQGNLNAQCSQHTGGEGGDLHPQAGKSEHVDTHLSIHAPLLTCFFCRPTWELRLDPYTCRWNRITISPPRP